MQCTGFVFVELRACVGMASCWPGAVQRCIPFTGGTNNKLFFLFIRLFTFFFHFFFIYFHAVACCPGSINLSRVCLSTGYQPGKWAAHSPLLTELLDRKSVV